MNCFSFSSTNCNSLLRANAKGNFLFPYFTLFKKTQDILLLSDTRISTKKFDFLSEKLSFSDQINVKKKRFFSSKSDNLRTGGASIYIPQCYDNVLNVIYEKCDSAEIPRFITLVCNITGGPNLTITSFYGCPGKTSEKAKVFRRLYGHLYDLTKKFCISITFLGGDFNQKLDNMNENNEDKKTFRKIISDFSLLDAFRVCPPSMSKNDISRLQRQDQIAYTSEEGFTYFPRINGNLRSRIDGIFFSSSLEHNLVEKSFCLSMPHPYSDHWNTHFFFAWDQAGIPAGNLKPSFHFRNHLLSDKTFIRIIKRDIARTILDYYMRMGGFLDKEVTDTIKIKCLESLLFDRMKNDNMPIPAIEIIYEILGRIEKSQNCYLKKRTSKEKTDEQRLVTEISKLEKIKKPKRSEQRMLAAACLELSDLQKKRIQRQSLDACIDYQTLGEFGSKFFLRSKVARRSKAFVRIFEKANGEIIHESRDIEQQFYDHFKGILQTPDPFSKEAFYRFVQPVKQNFGKIREIDKECFNKEISIQEVNLAVRKIRSNAAPGADGCTGRLLTFLHSICPRLICYAINNQLLRGACAEKDVMIKRLIFIPKPGVNKNTIKKYRPISLLNSILKLADTCIVSRLVASLENGKVLPPYMFAYRTGFSTTDAILSLQTFIDNANYTGRKLVILNWDVSQAFDKCSRLMVLECLKMLGCSDFLIDSLGKLPNGAIARICVNLAEARFPGIPAPHACPQGLGSSAQMFGIAMYILLLRLNYEDISLYKLDLCIQKEISPVEAFAELQWHKEGHTGQINKKFKQESKEQWNLFSKKEKSNIKASFGKKFHEQATTKLSDIASTVCYSDDGHLFLDYTNIQNILQVMEIFHQFGAFSGLKINPDKTKIITLNFSLSEDEINCLAGKGFNPNMISDGHQYFRFLGCEIKPYLLRDGATMRLNEICDDMENISEAFNNNCTLKGRRTVCQSLMISKLQSALTAFDLSEKDMCRIQKIINSFVHRKRIAAGKRKYLSFSKAGIEIPKYFERYLVARTSLLKGIFTKIANGLVIPLWGQVLIKALRFIGFSSPTLLFRSFGQADIRFIVKNFNELGLNSLASLFKSAEIINNIFEKRRSGQDRKRQKKTNDQRVSDCPDDILCLTYRVDIDGKIIDDKMVGYKDKHGRFHNLPNPPSYRSIPMIGCQDDEMLQARNRQSLFTIWKNLQPNNNIPAFEFSARNVKEMSCWIMNCASSANLLLDTNNQISPNKRILPLIQKSSRQKHIFNALATQAQTFCNKWLTLVGPSSPKYQSNILTGWISSCTMKNNGKSLYFQFLEAKYGLEQSTAIKKIEKLGGMGKVDEVRIGRGMARGIRTFNSAKMERSSIELSLCAVRNAADIARINGTPPKPCYCCGIFENNQALSLGGMYKHFFIDCSPAAFLIQYMRVFSLRVLGFRIEINLNLLIFNEIPYERCKNLSDDAKKVFFCLLNCFKNTIFALYYMRPSKITGSFLLSKLHQNINIAKQIAKERGSKLLNNIDFSPVICRSLKSFSYIHNRVMDETREFRKEDNITRRALRLSQNSNGPQINANVPRRIKHEKHKQPSLIKRQILIKDAFSRIKDKKYTNVGNLELTM